MNEKNEKNPIELNENDLTEVDGGASDYLSVCGIQLSKRCYFCVRAVHGRYQFKDIGWRDTIGCGLSPNALGSVNGVLLHSEGDVVDINLIV